MPSDKRQRQKERAQAARAERAAAAAAAKRRRNIILAALAIVAVFGFAFLYSALTGGDDTDVQTPGADDTAEPVQETEEPGEVDEGATPTTFPLADPVEPECPPEDGATERVTQFTEAPPFCLDEDATYEAVFETDAGDIRVELDVENMPNTVNNFVFLARWGYYDGTVFMRSNTGIDILQGGAPHTQTNADPGPGYTIEDEGDMFNYSAGDLVMARSQGPDSSGAQFFFGTGPNVNRLSPGPYLPVGRVVEGLDVLEAIMATHVGSAGQPDEGAPDPLPVVSTVRIVQS
jgi:cyclophilin family peptidyl-prolyl cis-trans isomerase